LQETYFLPTLKRDKKNIKGPACPKPTKEINLFSSSGCLKSPRKDNADDPNISRGMLEQVFEL
jgi:hypothetical protein